MPKVYILDPFHPAGVEMVRPHAELVMWDDPARVNWPDDADALMVRMTPITAADLKRAKKLKLVCKQGVGYDTIDIAAAKELGIPVSRTPGVNSEAVAELALTLALAVGRRVGEFDRLLRAGSPTQRASLLGIELTGKKVGIVGMGNIGTLVARKWAGGFGAQLFAHDPYVPASQWSDIPHTRVATLDELLAQVDVLSLHAPLTDETRNLISAPQLAKMKKDAILINCARGGMVNEMDLYQAITGGKIFGAGLDVFETEPPPADHPLLSLPTVLATPHAAAGTRETQERSATRVAEQVIEVLQGKPARNRVV
jgi:D-3-phosphoglycerate dehydrogenase